MLGIQCFGEINYKTGNIDLYTNIETTADSLVTVSIGVDYEEGAPIPKVSLETASKDVSAEVFALGMQIGLLKKFELMKRFGERAVDEEINTLSNELIMEIGQTAIQRINAQAVGKRTFDCKPSDYYSIREKLQGLKFAFSKSEGNIIDNAGIGQISNYICGAEAYAVVQNLEGFTDLNVTATGPHIAGTLDNKPVIRVPKLPGSTPMGLKANEILCEYKGPGSFDAGCVFAPYMPIVVTSNLLPMNNPMIEQGVAASWSAIEVVVPAYTTKVELIDIDALLNSSKK